MNNKIIAGVLGVVVVIGGAFFFMGNNESASTGENPQNSIAVGEPNPSTPTEENSGKKMSFDAFLKQGGSYVCTVNQSVEGIDSKGTVYIDKGNIRGDFNTSVAGMNVDTYFIVKDKYTYTWSSMMPGKGFKAPVSTGGSGDTSTGTSGQYSFNAEQIGDYDCKAWSVDASKFTLPSGVTFTEVKN
ncbi:MAG TPA: hypothetical protein PLZ99_01050 [Parcubacteria group bacterium]|jgi:hypothetical protein|nr:hypothetical protein [Parcubacteria group bacterium]